MGKPNIVGLVNPPVATNQPWKGNAGKPPAITKRNPTPAGAVKGTSK